MDRIPPLWENSTMALNIKDKETEALVAELASLTGETKTGAVRQALRERLERLRLRSGRKLRTAEDVQEWLKTEIWPLIPEDQRGKKLSKAEREEILGYGPDGV
jgi:antitoxin VapB